MSRVIDSVQQRLSAAIESGNATRAILHAASDFGGDGADPDIQLVATRIVTVLEAVGIQPDAILSEDISALTESSLALYGESLRSPEKYEFYRGYLLVVQHRVRGLLGDLRKATPATTAAQRQAAVLGHLSVLDRSIRELRILSSDVEFESPNLAEVEDKEAAADDHVNKYVERFTSIKRNIDDRLRQLAESGFPVPDHWLTINVTIPYKLDENSSRVTTLGETHKAWDIIAKEIETAAWRLKHEATPPVEVKYDGTTRYPESVIQRVAAERAEHERMAITNTVIREMVYEPAARHPTAQNEPTEPEVDGPVPGFRWRHNDKIIMVQMAESAWRLVNHLWECEVKSASYSELAPIVADDHAESMLDQSTCRGHRNRANAYFKKHKIPWHVSLRGRPSLIPADSE